MRMYTKLRFSRQVFLLLTACLLLAGCAAPTPKEVTPAVPTTASQGLWAAWEAMGQEASSEDGLFRLSLAGKTGVYPAGEPLDFGAQLAYLGGEEEVTLKSSEPLVLFLIRGNGYSSGEPWWAYVQLATPIRSEAPLAFPFRLHSVFEPGSSEESFFKEAYQNEELRLPPGNYDIIAVAMFGAQRAAARFADSYELYAGMQIRVESPGEKAGAQPQ